MLHLFNRFQEFKFSQYSFYLTVFGENLVGKGFPFSASLSSESETRLHVPFFPQYFNFKSLCDFLYLRYVSCVKHDCSSFRSVFSQSTHLYILTEEFCSDTFDYRYTEFFSIFLLFVILMCSMLSVSFFFLFSCF